MGVEAKSTLPESGTYAKVTKKLETAASASGARPFYVAVYTGGGHQSHAGYSPANSTGHGAVECYPVSDC